MIQCQSDLLDKTSLESKISNLFLDLQIWQVTVLQPLEVWWWKVDHLKAQSHTSFNAKFLKVGFILDTPFPSFEKVSNLSKNRPLISCWNCIIWYIMLQLLVTTYLLWGKQMLLRDAIKRRFSKSAPLWFRSNLSLFYAFLYTTLVIFYFSKAYYSPEKKSEILLAN